MEQLAGRGMTSLDIRFVNPLCVLVLIGLYRDVIVSCGNCSVDSLLAFNVWV
jgi:hypothetical protein